MANYGSLYIENILTMIYYFNYGKAIIIQEIRNIISNNSF